MCISEDVWECIIFLNILQYTEDKVVLMESNHDKLSFITNVSCMLHEGKRLITYFIIHPFLYKTNFRIKNPTNPHKGNIRSIYNN